MSSTDDFDEYFESASTASASASASALSYSVQTILLATVPKFPAALSILSSLFIVLDVTRNRKRWKVLSNRIMVGLSCSDILASSVYFVGTWFIPRGTIGQYGPVYLASGNSATCSASGFFTQLAICSPIYKASLCLYYLLSARYGWTDRSLKKLEPLLHAVPISFALGTATAGAILNMYGSAEWLCWVNPVIPSSTTWIYQWAFLFVPLWTIVLFVSYVMFSLWWIMRNQEQKMATRYQLQSPETTTTTATTATTTSVINGRTTNVDMMEDMSDQEAPPAVPLVRDSSNVSSTQSLARPNTHRRSIIINNNTRSLSKKIAVQGMLYILAFYITWFFPSLQRLIELAIGTNFFVLQFFDSALLPLQGLLNLVIFVRPRYIRVRLQTPELNCWRGFWQTMYAILYASLTAADSVTTASRASSANT